MTFTPVTVTATYTNADGSVPTGVVQFTPTAVLSNAGLQSTTHMKVMTLTGGVGAIVLYAGDDVGTSPSGSGYSVQEFIDGGPPRTYLIILSRSAPAVALGSLTPVVTAPLYTYALLTSVGVPNGVAALDATGKVPLTQTNLTTAAADATAKASAAQAAAILSTSQLIQWAKNPDTIIAGAVTGDPVTSAAVVWPDGTPGTLSITSRDSNTAVLAYSITYGSPVTKTFTQPTITRNANSAATNVPQIVVS